MNTLRHRCAVMTALLLAVPAGCGRAAGAGRVSGAEDFSTDPAARGWRVHGDAGLFGWAPDRGALRVTWDSSRPNSFYHLPLPRPVTRADDFGFAFTLHLESHAVGVHPDKPGTFQIAFGLVGLADATDPAFQRGVFLRSRNLVEWTWFGSDSAISASVSPVVVPADGRLPWGYRDTFLGIPPGVDHRFEVSWSAAAQSLSVALTVAGAPGPEILPVRVPQGFTDFSVDALAVSSYSDAGQDPRFAGSVLARGWIDDIAWDFPDAAIGEIRYTGNGSFRQVTFPSRAGWNYTLEITTDLVEWVPVSGPVPGTGGDLEMIDPRRVLLPEAFLRVRATRP